MYKVQFVLYFFFFNDTNMSMVVRKKKKDFTGEIHLLIKKAKVQPNTNEWSNILADRSSTLTGHFIHF